MRCGSLPVLALLFIGALVGRLPGAEPPVAVDLPPRLDLAKFTDLMGDLLQVSITYQPGRLQGQTHLALRGQYPGPELWQLYNQVLAANGFTTVIAGEPPVYQVVPLAEAEGLSRLQAPAALAALRLPPGYVALVIDLQHLAAEQAVQILAPLAGGQQAQLKAMGRNGEQLILSGLRERVTEVQGLLARLDIPALRPVYQEFAPQAASPSRLQAALTAAWAAAGRVRGKQGTLELQLTPDGRRLLIITSADMVAEVVTLAQQLDQADPVQTRSYRTGEFAIDEVASLLEQLFPREEGVQGEVRIVRDQLSDSLIITASEAQHARIAALMKELEQAPEANRRHMRSFPIKHRKAVDLQKLVEELLATGLTADEGGGATADVQAPAPEPEPAVGPAADGQAAAAPAPATPQARPGPVTGPDLQLSVDDATNTLIGIGSSKALERVAGLLEKLDKRLPQVELEIIIVKLSDIERHVLGIKMAAVFRDDDVRTGFASLLNPKDLASTGAEAILPASGAAILNPGEFAGFLEAAESVTDDTSVVRSTLMVDNNAEASLDSVRQVPFSSVNSGDTVSTTSFGGTQDAGPKVKLTPTIASGDYLTLTYSLSDSSFESTSGGTDSEGSELPPPRNTNDLSGVTTIPDGHCVLLGGQNTVREGSTISKVPLLGSLPLIGWLFRHKQNNKDTVRIFFLVRASVLRHQTFEDLKYLGSKALVEAKLADPDWPALAPRFLD